MLEIRGLTVRYGNLTIVDNISFSLQANEWLMIVGPNGAGKSTIVNAITQGVPYTGEVLLRGTDISRSKPAWLARNVGVLTQSHHVGYSFTVEEVVRLGRYSYSSGIFSSPSDEDNDMVEKALSLTGMLPFRAQSMLTLSGGELQRAFLAQVFAQDPGLLILAAPENHLDLVYQKQVFELIRDWAKSAGRAVISVVHDLNLARTYGTNAILLNKGRIVSSGSIGEALACQNLERVYAMNVQQWMRDLLIQWQ